MRTTRPRLAVLALLATSVRAQDAALLYKSALDLQQQGDLNGAAQAYKKSLKIDGTNIAAHSNLGVVLARLGRYDEAIPEYQQALNNAPERFRPVLRRNLALAWYKSGRLSEAAPLLIELHDAQPSDIEAAMLASDCLLQLGEPEKGVAILEPLLPSSGGDKAFAYLLGIAYLKTGKTAEAQRILDPILRDESSAEGRYALGMAMFTSGDYPAAAKAFARAIELNPSLPHLHSYHGQSLMITGDPDGALDAFHRQLAADPNDYEANFESALILQRRGRHNDAEPLLNRAVLLRSDSAAAHIALARTLLALDKQSEARTELETIVHVWPQAGEAHARLAEVYAKSGQRADAARERTLAAKYPASKPENTDSGIQTGSIAPKLRLAHPGGGSTTEITSPVKGKPTVLVFGSYTCPNFRKAAPVLNELAQSLGSRVSFLQVYIREAHPTGEWQSTINERENVQLAAASSVEQKHGYAVMCQRRLHLNFPAVVDGLDNAAEQAYKAWPSRVYVLSEDGRIRYSSSLIEEEFDAAALKAAIQSVASTTATRRNSSK